MHRIRPLDPARARARDAAGWNYGSAYPPSYQAYGRYRALLTVELARATRPSRVLEVAAGDGALAATLALDGAEVVANDLRAEHLRESLGSFLNGESVRLAPGNALELDPAEIGRFDLIAACEVIEHVAHPDALLTGLARLLQPGGRILLTTPNGLHFRNTLPTFDQVTDPRALEAIQFRPDADGHLFLLTPSELRRLARQAGLRVERLEVCASPMITGHGGMRWLAGCLPVAWLHCLDGFLLEGALRERLGYVIFALLTADER